MKNKALIKEWNKNQSEVYRLTLDEYKNRPQLSLRAWFKDDAGEFKPGRIGINFGVDHFENLFDAMRRMEKRARKRGLLPPKRRS